MTFRHYYHEHNHGLASTNKFQVNSAWPSLRG